MKICNYCNTINSDSAQFCNKCGTPLEISQHGIQQSSTPTRNQAQYQQDDQSFYQKQETNISSNQLSSPSNHQHIGFIEAIKICFQKYATFSGRAKRPEYWYFALFQWLICFPVGLIFTIIDIMIEAEGILSSIGIILASLPFICPSISVLVRRLHDTGRSGWWYWLCLIPYIGGLILLVFTCLDSEPRDNKYGPYIN